MAVSPQNLYREPMPSEATSPKDSAACDLQYRDVAYVYPVTMVKGEMGSNTERWSTTPHSTRCSFQEHALDTAQTDPNTPGSRFARIYTRDRNAVKWHDKLTVRSIEMLVTKVTNHYDNFTGRYHHTEIRALFEDAPLEEPRSG